MVGGRPRSILLVALRRDAVPGLSHFKKLLPVQIILHVARKGAARFRVLPVFEAFGHCKFCLDAPLANQIGAVQSICRSKTYSFQKIEAPPLVLEMSRHCGRHTGRGPRH